MIASSSPKDQQLKVSDKEMRLEFLGNLHHRYLEEKRGELEFNSQHI